MEQTISNKPMIDRRKAFSAIDIGTTKIVALVGYVNEKNELTVLGRGVAPSMGVSRGEVINIEYTVSSIKAAVKQAEEEAGFFCKKVVVGIAGKHIRTLQNRGGINRENPDKEITNEELEILMQENRHVCLEADEEIIHAIPQTYIVDNNHEVTCPLGMHGRRIEANFHIVVGKGTAIKYIRTAIQRAGLEVSELLLEPLASAKSTLTEEEKRLGVAILDIGGGTTDVAIFHNNVVQFTEVIPFGGNAITHDISVEYNILEELAEKLKVEYGCAIQDVVKDNEIVSIPGVHGRPPKEISFKVLAGIIQARMEEILDAALFVIKTSGYGKYLSQGIVVTGGGSLMQHLTQLINFKINKDAKIGTPIHCVNYMNAREFSNPIYATGVGLLMRAAELHKAQNVHVEVENTIHNQTKEQVQPAAVKQTATPKVEEHKKEKNNYIYKLVEKFFGDTATDTKLSETGVGK
ncbi:MAG TPA: cell division protein FtsA [Bacteroidales bacterium]|nr:cell division protein FtsA [Bacteroidales bacterium]